MKVFIPKSKGVAWELRAKLGKLKSENIALNGGKSKASYTRIKTDNENVLAFKREKNGKKVYYIANLSAESVNVKIDLNGNFTNYMAGKSMGINSNQVYSVLPWQYYILTN